MRDTNKSFLSAATFGDRVFKVLEAKGITIDQLYSTLVNEIGYEITRNNLNLYLKRIPNVNFLVALSRAIGVPTDYLLGIDNESDFNSGLYFKYTNHKYTKYLHDDYYMYFFATAKNAEHRLIEAKLSIKYDSFYRVEMFIPLDTGNFKCYEGELIISDTYKISYITLHGVNFGEIVHISFIDPSLNIEGATFQLAIGAMSSISGGGLSRIPVMSRCVISRQKITSNKLDMIKANLKLNSKYINVSPDDLKRAVRENISVPEKAENIIKRIQQAFPIKETHSIVESFLIDTIRSDFNLNDEEITKLLISLRMKSNSDSLAKINKSLDDRIYRYIHSNDNSDS